MKNLPKANILLLCFNQEDYIKESLESCLAQDYKNLHIIISDDASNDNTVKIIKSVIQNYKGPHQITINQNKENMGIGRHFAYVMDHLAEGEISVMCAGDDISLRNRTTRIVDNWLKNGKPSLIAHNLIEISENGDTIEDLRTLTYKLQNYDAFNNNLYAIQEYLRNPHPIPFVGAAVAYCNETYKKFNSPKAFPDYEDHLMLFRALLDKGIYYFDETLIKYRRHTNSFMAGEIRTFKDKPNALLSVYFDKEQNIKSEFRNSYTSHKVTVQQWIDYLYAIKTYGIRINYQIVTLLWQSINIRHKYLLKNNGTPYANPTRPNYISPLNTVVFGTNISTKNLIKNISPGFNIIAACDNVNSQLKDSTIYGLDVIDLDDLNKKREHFDCIIVASQNFYQIKDMIIKKTGIDPAKIIRPPALDLTAYINQD